MATEKQIQARFSQKTDTTENWDTAGRKGFIPKKGEIIVYQDSIGEVPKIKIGDGSTTVRELPFAGGGSSGVGMTTPESGEIFGDYEYNKATDHYAHAEGTHTEAAWRSHAEGYHTFA